MTRNQKVGTSTYPELTGALEAQQAGDFIIDGEIVALAGAQTSFAVIRAAFEFDDAVNPSDSGPGISR
jgi:ATP-dependent DNA ligase